MPPREVTVVGSGQVRGAPDILNADIGIEVVAPDVSGAVSESNDKARQMIDAIVAAGVAPEDVQTSDLSVQPQYDASGGPFVGGQRDRLPGDQLGTNRRPRSRQSLFCPGRRHRGGRKRGTARQRRLRHRRRLSASGRPLAPGPSRTRRTVPSSTPICPVRRSRTS